MNVIEPFPVPGRQNEERMKYKSDPDTNLMLQGVFKGARQTINVSFLSVGRAFPRLTSASPFIIYFLK